MIDEDPRRVSPVQWAPELNEFEGMWVAVYRGEVIAAARSSRELAQHLHLMDHRKRRESVVEYVRPSTDSYIVGVG
jgi:hypothetical protein